jgi:hypothetical protein
MHRATIARSCGNLPRPSSDAAGTLWPLDRSCTEGSAELAITLYSVAPGISGTRVDLQEFRQSLGQSAPPRGIQSLKPYGMTRRTSGTRRTTSCSKKTTPRAPGFMPTCIARKATTATPATGTGVRNGPLPAERSRKNGKGSRWRWVAMGTVAIDGSKVKANASKRDELRTDEGGGRAAQRASAPAP